MLKPQHKKTKHSKPVWNTLKLIVIKVETILIQKTNYQDLF